MTVKKLENSSDVNVVTEEVKILTDLLNESTEQLIGNFVGYLQFMATDNIRLH